MKLLELKMKYYLQRSIIAFELGCTKDVDKYSELYTKCLNQLKPNK